MDTFNCDSGCPLDTLSRQQLEKEYTALKTKENEDQIELRRLRTENRLLRQRIENLEKVEAKLLRKNEESSTLADKLVQDQVTWAQEVEQSYALRNEISVLRQQLQETQKKLFEAEDILGDIRTRTRIIEDAVHLDEAEERNMVKHLQEELIAVRLRETDTAITIKELRQKVVDLEDSNLRLQRAPSNDVQQLQEELIAVKLREAEANLSMKELRMKVNEIESYWEAHMERVRQSSPKEKGTKQEVRHLQEEVMALKLKEARAVADVKDVKQKLMELETQNHICTNQIRRIGEENKELKKQLEEAAEREKDLKINIKDLTRKLDDTETKRREEAMMARIKDAENIQLIADLRHRIAEIDIQKEEVLAAGQLQDKGENQELKNKLHDLQDEVLQLQLSLSSQPVRDRCVMTDSYLGNNSDEELDAELRDSENLDQTLSDIIEGKNNASSVLYGHDIEDASSSVSGVNASRCSIPSSSNLYQSTNSVLEPSFGLHVDSLSAHLATSSTDLPGGSILGSGGGVSSTSVSSSWLTSHGASDISQQYSGESTVINKCDQAQGRQSPECQGKSLTAPPRSHCVSQVLRPIAPRGSPHTLVQGGKSHIYQGRGSKGQGSHSLPQPASLDISRSWELYEEEVELDSSLEARVVSRISAVQDFRAGVANRETMPGSDLDSHIPQTCPSSRRVKPADSGELGLSKAVSRANQACRPVALDPNGNTAEVDNCYQDDYADKLGKSYEGDTIPDVVVIYEPSCGPGSLICTCDGGQESEFILKESTV